MGEYEPNDSRKVTHSDTSAPGEPPRTGAHEDETRQAAKGKEHDERQAKRMKEQQQRGSQSQSQDQSQDQSQTKGQTTPKGNAQASYGNSRDEDGASDKGMAGEGMADEAARAATDPNDPHAAQQDAARRKVAGETSDDPAVRAHADANPELYQPDE